MNKTGLDIRKMFLHLKELKLSKQEIALYTNKSKSTVYSWWNMPEEELLKPIVATKRKNTDKLKQVFETNQTAFHKELETELGIKKTQIGYWRNKLGFGRKKAQTTYKEQDEAKKNKQKRN